MNSQRIYLWRGVQVLIAPRTGFTAANQFREFVPTTDYSASRKSILISRDPLERWVSGVYHYSRNAHHTLIRKLIPRYMDYMYMHYPTTEEFATFFDRVTCVVENLEPSDYHYTSIHAYTQAVAREIDYHRIIPTHGQRVYFGENYREANISSVYTGKTKQEWIRRAEPLRARIQALWPQDQLYWDRSQHEWSTLPTVRP